MKNIIYLILILTLFPIANGADTPNIIEFEGAKEVPDLEAPLIETSSMNEVPLPSIVKTSLPAITPTFQNILTATPVEKSSNDIPSILRKHVPQFHLCYQTELDSTEKLQGLQGKINLKILIDQSGKIKTTKITSQDISSRDVAKCFKLVLESIQFPATGKNLEINQSINLSAKKI